MGARSFLARLDATKAILAVTHGRPTFNNIVELEKRELLTALERVTARGQDAADIIGGIKSAKFPDDVEEALISRVCELLTAAPSPAIQAQSNQDGSVRGGYRGAGLVYQDFTSIVEFIPEKVWTFCSQTKSGLGILKTAVALGLRRGTEPTYKMLSLCHLC